MLNQKHNVHKRTNSKILLVFICIFGLLFSWSCSCKNRVSNPDGGGGDGGGQFVDPDTFAIKEATGNVVASIVQSSKTVGDIKIAFAEANNHDYTIDYTVDDANETVEANKIDKTNFQVVNNVLTASESLLTKVRALNTDNGPARKTITINFTFKANDTSLKNNTQTLSVEVKLTHAQLVNTTPLQKNKIEEIFKAVGQLEVYRGYNFDFSDASTTFTDLQIQVKNKSKIGADEGHSVTISEFKKELLDNPPYGLNQEAVKNLGYISSSKFDNTQQEKVNGTTATFYVVLTFNPEYDTEGKDITVQIDADAKGNSNSGKWDTTQNS